MQLICTLKNRLKPKYKERKQKQKTKIMEQDGILSRKLKSMTKKKKINGDKFR